MRRKDVQAWLDKAAEDEQVTELISREQGLWAVVGFHAQQAAEKYLKAAVVNAGSVPPRTHDVELLIALVGEPAGGDIKAAAASLTALAVMTRYPDGPVITEADATKAMADLTLLKNWALNAIGS